MRFLCIYKPGVPEDTPTTQDHMTKMNQLIQEMIRAGVLITTEGCQPSSKGFRVSVDGDDFRVVDGPFSETKELIGGFAIIQVKSKDEAVHWTKRFLTTAGRGVSEVRLLHEQPAA
jgi:hypothetical protein